jgi:transposase
MGAISPRGASYYRLQESSYTGSAVAQFSRDLLGLTPQKLHIIWDGASIHLRSEVKDWLRPENQDGRVQLTLLPAYSPQLNAAEPVWAWLQGGELKNVCCQTLDELTQQVPQAFAKLTDQTEIIRHCFTPPEVAFY